VLPRMLWRRHRKQPQIDEVGGRCQGPCGWWWESWSTGSWSASLGLPLLHRHYYYMTAQMIFDRRTCVAGAACSVPRNGSAARYRAIDRGSTGTGIAGAAGSAHRQGGGRLICRAHCAGNPGLQHDDGPWPGSASGGLAIGFWRAGKNHREPVSAAFHCWETKSFASGIAATSTAEWGTVEDISLRSTRIRTIERTELSIPNGTLATMNVENLSRRDKILFNPKIGFALRDHGRPVALCAGPGPAAALRAPQSRDPPAPGSVLQHSTTAGLRSRSSVTSLTRDFAEFTAIREDILLRLMDVVADAGTAFAFPLADPLPGP